MLIKSKVLIIAGSDSSGGAGIQADIKTVTSLGSYAMTAITAVTAQNTTGVKSIIPIHPKEGDDDGSTDQIFKYKNMRKCMSVHHHSNDFCKKTPCSYKK